MTQRIVIIGAGPGGYVAAIRAAQLGGEVTIIEDYEVGGTCLNWGCIPTKALVYSAEALLMVQHARDYGVEVRGDVTYSLEAMMHRKDKIVASQVKGIRSLFKSNKIRLVDGRGWLKEKHIVSVAKKEGDTEEIDADRVIIATGSRPANIPAFPLDGRKILSSNDMLGLEKIPDSLLIIGAGVIGCEFAFILNALGCKVTMVEMLPHAISIVDEEISILLERELKKKKIKLHCSEKIEAVKENESGQMVATLGSGKEIVTDQVLVSIGRAFNTEGLNLETVGVSCGPRGEIQVNEKMETSLSHVYAIGDVTGGILLAHVASTEGIVAAENAMGGAQTMDYAVVPGGIFTMPEIGTVGLSEQQAKEKGYEVRVGTFPFRGLGKSHAMGKITGLAKVVADAKSDRLLGLHVMGAHGSDIVHEGAVAMKMGGTLSDLGHTIHSHPTLSEAVLEASHAAHGVAIHIPPN
ncbi:MAG: dihydrolipoyl dehydrogenase [bacterium]|nr:dihydrolipoyl dehydrogenase [bacterium]